ncbi:MAG: YihY/virulence factor BrkB family protein [Elusimicrobiota bacterium]
MTSKIKNFINEKIWVINTEKYGSIRGFLFRVLKIIIIISKDFVRDKCHMLASSLTYYTLLAVIPTAAVIFTVLQKLGIQRTYGADFINKVIFDPELASEIINYVDTAQLSALGIIGAVLLLKITVFLLLNVEKAFNDIWGVKESRALYKKLIYYISAIIILPVVITVGLSGAMNFAGNVFPVSSGLFPVVITMVGFSFLYFAFPVVGIKIKAALAGGITAGILWHISYRIYLIWATAAATEFNLIYGSFSQFVLVFLWVYISWIVILIGAETSFAVQNYKIYKREGRPGDISFSLKEKAALLVSSIIYRNCQEKGDPLSAEEIVKKAGGPIKLINRILYELTEVGILTEFHQQKTRYFKPAGEDEEVTAWQVVNALNSEGVNKAEFNNSNKYNKIENLFQERDELLKEKFNSISLTEI